MHANAAEPPRKHTDWENLRTWVRLILPDLTRSSQNVPTKNMTAMVDT